MLLAVMMILALSAPAFAANGPLTLEQAKQAALDYACVRASEATFTKAHRDYDDGREVYEIEFYANGTEYDIDVDVYTGRITDFSMEQHYGYGAGRDYGYGTGSDYGYNGYGRYYDDDLYDYDFDDFFDSDWSFINLHKKQKSRHDG